MIDILNSFYFLVNLFYYLLVVGLAALDYRFNAFSEDEARADSRSTRLMAAAFTSNACVLRTDAGPKLWRTIPTPIYRKFKKAQDFMEE